MPSGYMICIGSTFSDPLLITVHVLEQHFDFPDDDRSHDDGGGIGDDKPSSIIQQERLLK